MTKLLGSTLLLFVVICTVWYFFPAGLQLSAPSFSRRSDGFLVTSQVSNHTNRAATLQLRFKIGCPHEDQVKGSTFTEYASQDVAVTVAASTNIVATCQFPNTARFYPATAAEAQIISSRSTGL